MKNTLLSFFVMVFMIFVSCSKNNVTVERSQLQIREFQTRQFENVDSLRVIKAMVDVLQDMDYIIHTANVELGIISASKEIDVESVNFLWKWWKGNDAVYDKIRSIECTANVSSYDNLVKIRANFKNKIVNNKGLTEFVEVIADENFYREFFSKVDKGLFYHNEGI